jgi:hypothetical protein
VAEMALFRASETEFSVGRILTVATAKTFVRPDSSKILRTWSMMGRPSLSFRNESSEIWVQFRRHNNLFPGQKSDEGGTQRGLCQILGAAEQRELEERV